MPEIKEEPKDLEKLPTIQQKIEEECSKKAIEQFHESSIACPWRRHTSILEEKIVNEKISKEQIADWLEEEGFEIEKHNNKREYFRFIAEKKNEKINRQYVFELADYGKRISGIKLLILEAPETAI